MFGYGGFPGMGYGGMGGFPGMGYGGMGGFPGYYSASAFGPGYYWYRRSWMYGVWPLWRGSWPRPY